MKNRVFFSIIVPVFNVEKYIEDCINSLLEQSFEDFEIILINDGSSDNSYMICKQLAENDGRIRLFTKENQGLSATRNMGIEKSRGDYIIFVDGDDYLDKDSLFEFKKVLDKDTDVLITRLVEAYQEKMIYRDEKITSVLKEELSKTEAIEWIMEKSFNTWPAVKYIVSRKVLEKNRLRFREGFLHEDLDWTARLCAYADRFKICAHPWYYHRMERQGSITNTVKPKRITDVLTMAYDLIDGDYSYVFDGLSTYEKEVVINRIMSSVYPTINHIKNIEKKDWDLIIKEMKRCKSIFRFSPDRKYKIFSVLLKILGYKNSLRLLTLIG